MGTGYYGYYSGKRWQPAPIKVGGTIPKASRDRARKRRK